jgi:hypothetical protein
MKTTLLEKKFIGKGEVKGMEFEQVFRSSEWYIYKVTDEGKVHYERFKRIEAPICIDFANRVYSDVEFKEVYPNAKDFGITAFTFNDYTKALMFIL